MPAYTVLSVAPNPRAYDANGPKLAYKVRFTEHSDKEVEWSQKAETDAPKIGQSVDGTIDWNARFGPKFTREYQNKGGGGGSTWKPRDPAETAAIQRQHSQGIAARIAIAAGWFNDWNPHDTEGAGMWTEFVKLTDRLQRDIDRGKKLAAHDSQAVQSYGQRRDTVLTGESDVPSEAPSHGDPGPQDVPFPVTS